MHRFLNSLLALTLTLALVGSLAAQGDENTDDPPLTGELPWERESPSPGELKRPESPRELLAGYGIGEEELARFIDGAPLSAEEVQVLQRILYRVPHIRKDFVEGWARPGETLAALGGEPAAERMEFFHLKGTVAAAEKINYVVGRPPIVEFEHYYRLRINLANSENDAIVYARHAPEAWLAAEMLAEPVSCRGLFLKVGGTSAADGDAKSGAELIFAADRVSWHPLEPNEDLNVTADEVLLAEYGVDIGELGDVHDRGGTMIERGDREAFFQVLKAVGEADPDRLAGLARPIDLAALIQSPDRQRGRVIAVEGVIRRVTPVLLNGDQYADVRSRFGIDRYYQIDVFVPLDRPLQFVDPKSPGEKITYRNDYAVNICVLELPEELQGEGVDLDNVRHPIRIEAVYFKLWSAETEFVTQADKKKRQASPMLIGRRGTTIEPVTSPMTAFVTGAAGLLIVLLAAGTVYFIWRARAGDRPAEQKARQEEETRAESLATLDLESAGPPDFSHLEGVELRPRKSERKDTE